MKGISKRTTKLGFHVLRLHYSADPEKDPTTSQGKRWYEEARKGMSDARWRQEHEIDYGALGGQLVFPGFDESIHVVPSRLPLDPERYTIWLGADTHMRTPDAFCWVAVDREGDLSVVWSWWPDEKLIIRKCAEVLKRIDGTCLEPYYRVMDVAGKGQSADEEHDRFEAYQDAGFTSSRQRKTATERALIFSTTH